MRFEDVLSQEADLHIHGRSSNESCWLCDPRSACLLRDQKLVARPTHSVLSPGRPLCGLKLVISLMEAERLGMATPDPIASSPLWFSRSGSKSFRDIETAAPGIRSNRYG